MLNLAAKVEVIFGERELLLPNICTYYPEADTSSGNWQGAFGTRTARLGAVSLAQLPRGALVFGLDASLAVDGYFVAEQIPVNEPADLGWMQDRMAQQGAAVDVPEETVLIARYGDGVWGHWLVELLPKIVVCEHTFPGRFKYALSNSVISSQGVTRDRILESISSYGVSDDRLMLLRDDTIYRFAKLRGLTPTYMDFAPHPEVNKILIEDMGKGNARAAVPSKVALMRSDSRRTIDNMHEVNDFLRSERFVPIEIAALSFAQQVQIFNDAKTIFSVLGSGLSGLIYAQDGCRVLAACPSHWSDRFFYGILQAKAGSFWAEARGGTIQADNMEGTSNFHLPLQMMREAAESLGV